MVGYALRLRVFNHRTRERLTHPTNAAPIASIAAPLHSRPARGARPC
ncbi:protein of unknown function [Bradyrhizobium vignae]|uniref:Uncharacterized protein n=1 Tax=Bradyrhizobium vignae TaxID=1549949 RepID=A0A2U3PWW6_9BRAD|nr:protein of unknown function [Bradyrhizobium vignae]